MKQKAEYHPAWVPAGNGKADYDCALVHLSCRYYPRGGGFLTFDLAAGFAGNDARPEKRPSAIVGICIGDIVSGPYEDLAEARFEGDTEEDVKDKVEAWAKEMIARVDSSVRREFGVSE